MKQPGQIILFRFPQADLAQGKPRPALLIGKLPGQYDDWLICMISTQMKHYVQSWLMFSTSDRVKYEAWTFQSQI